MGEGTPLATLAKAGLEVWGFDISTEMVKKSKHRLRQAGVDPDRIFWADIQDPATYAALFQEGPFDALMAMGVMPHVRNDDVVLTNMATLVRPGGSVFIEFRNSLFSLFTLNRCTAEFILDELLAGVNPALKEQVAEDLRARLRIDLPQQANGYPTKFHNPLTIGEQFARHGFQDIKLLWYHYHPAMPYLEDAMPELYREESLRLEHEPSGWRGLFLCSAFVVEAVRQG